MSCLKRWVAFLLKAGLMSLCEVWTHVDGMAVIQMTCFRPVHLPWRREQLSA